MNNATNLQNVRLDQFFTVAEARHDRWRSLLSAARAWEGSSKRQDPELETKHADLSAAFADLRQWEDFFAYPGSTLLKTVQARISEGDITGTIRLVQAISAALLTNSYR